MHLLERSLQQASGPVPGGTRPGSTDPASPATTRRALARHAPACAGLEGPAAGPAARPPRAPHAPRAQGVSPRGPGRIPAPPPSRDGLPRQHVTAPRAPLCGHRPSPCGSRADGWRVKRRRDACATHPAAVRDATGRRPRPAGAWGETRLAHTGPRTAPRAEKQTPGWQQGAPPSASGQRHGRSPSFWSLPRSAPTPPTSTAAGAPGPLGPSASAPAAPKGHPVWRVASPPPALLWAAGGTRDIPALPGVSAAAPAAVAHAPTAPAAGACHEAHKPCREAVAHAARLGGARPPGPLCSRVQSPRTLRAVAHSAGLRGDGVGDDRRRQHQGPAARVA
jgi:hypothetical protein